MVESSASTHDTPPITATSSQRRSLGSRLMKYTPLGSTWKLNKVSMPLTALSMLSASSTPATTPSSVPIRPTTEPCTMNTFMMLAGLAPRVRKMAMSGCLSVTVITSIDTRLNAATAMISVRMMNIMRFSICTAANQLRFSRDQSRT